jgi:hypothetical protein
MKYSYVIIVFGRKDHKITVTVSNGVIRGYQRGCQKIPKGLSEDNKGVIKKISKRLSEDTKGEVDITHNSLASGNEIFIRNYCFWT